MVLNVPEGSLKLLLSVKMEDGKWFMGLNP